MNSRRINRISVLLLVIGFGGALAIYLTTDPATFDPLIGDPWASKRFVHEMRVIGGKSNAAAAELFDGFKSLWVGRNLAGTVAVLTVVVTLAFRFVAARPDIYAPQPVPTKKTPPVVT